MNQEMKKIEVVAAVIFKDGKVFATQRGHGDFKDGWEFPGGKIEPGETPEDALRREIREELETDVLVRELIDTIEYDYHDFHLSMKCFAYSLIRESMTIVTGPSLTRETCISAPNIPLPTCLPSAAETSSQYFS